MIITIVRGQTNTKGSFAISSTRSEVRREVPMGMPSTVVGKVILRSVGNTPVMAAAIPSVPGPVVVVVGELEHEHVALLILPPFVAIKVLEDCLLAQHIVLSVRAAEQLVQLLEVVRPRRLVAEAGKHLHGAELRPRRLVLGRSREARRRGWPGWRWGSA